MPNPNDPTRDLELLVPDLELERPPRSAGQRAPAPTSARRLGQVNATPPSSSEPGFGQLEDDWMMSSAHVGGDAAQSAEPLNLSTALDDDFMLGSSANTSSGGASPVSGSAELGEYFGGGQFESDALGVGLDEEHAGITDAPGTGRPDGPGMRDERPWPQGRSPDRSALRVDPIEIALASGYGKAPSLALLAPQYAVRVLLQQRKLRATLHDAEAALTTAENERDQVLIEAVTRLRPRLEQSDRFARLLEPVRELEQLTRERSAGLEAAHAELQAQLASLDARIAEIETKKQPIAAQRASDAASVETLDANFKRLAAKLKRIEIEARNVTEQARRVVGPEGGAVPAELASQVAGLEAQRDELTPDVNAAEERLESARRALDELDRQLAAEDRAIQKIEAQKRALDKQYRDQLNARARGVSEAETQMRTAVADLGRAVLALRGEVPLEAALLDELRTRDAAVLTAAQHAEKQLRALDSYDANTLARGKTLIGVALALLVALMLFAMLR